MFSVTKQCIKLFNDVQIKLFMLDSNILNNFSVGELINYLKMLSTNYAFTNHVSKEDLVLNNPQ